MVALLSLALLVLLLGAGAGHALAQSPLGERVTGYVRGAAQEISVLAIGQGFYLREDAARSWLRLSELASSEGMGLRVNSAFRWAEEQLRLWNAYQLDPDNAPQAAQPGWSNHQGGTALDIQVESSSTSPAYLWLASNAGAYGWSNAGKAYSPPEFWHWEYSPERDTHA